MIKYFIITVFLMMSSFVNAEEVKTSGETHKDAASSFPRFDCDGQYMIWFAPNESGIYFYEEKPNNLYSIKKILDYDLYDNPDFKGEAKVKLNKEGLFVNKIKKCSWFIEPKDPDGRYSKVTPWRLAKYDSKTKTDKFQECDLKGTKYFGFLVTNATEKYYEVELDKTKYYINANMKPIPEYNKSQNSTSEEYLKMFYDQFNTSFKENQKKFIDYVEMNKKCYEKNLSDKSCELNKIPNWFVRYMCFSKEVECPDRISKWKLTKKMQEIYRKNLSQCFDYKNMKMLLSELRSDDKRYSNLDLSKPIKFATIFTKLNNYKFSIYCDFKLEFDNNTIKNINAELNLDASFPGDSVETENPDADPDVPDYYEFGSYRLERTNECRIAEQPKNIISVSEIGDKNAKKLGN